MFSAKLKYLLIILLITLLSIGSVEAFYYVLDKKLSSSTKHPPTPATEQPRVVRQPTKPTTKDIDVSSITRRNLFMSRTGAAPPPSDKDPLEGLEPSSLAVVLMGTVTGPDEERRAVIYDKKQRKQELYQKGDFVHQASIKEILRGKVIITLNGKDEMLDIADARSVKVPQPRTAAAPKTTAKRVVGRPAGRSRQVAGQDDDTPRVAVPRPRNPSRINNVRGRVIVKGRDTSEP